MIIRARDIKKIYPKSKRVVLDIKEIDIEKGGFYVVSGKSGSGKSTLLAILGGYLRPTEGQVFLDDRDITSLSDAELTGLHHGKTGYVPQSNAMLKHQTVLDNILLPNILAGSDKNMEDKAGSILERLEISDLRDRSPHELSGGELKRVCIARALISDPEIVIADEPTTGLDHVTSKSILDFLGSLSRQGITVIIASHDELALSYGKNIELDNGHLSERKQQ